MINFSKQLGVVTTAIALTSATVGVLPAAAFQIIKHEFSGTLELLYYPSFFSSEPPFPTINYEGFVEYTTEGELLSLFLDGPLLYFFPDINPRTVFTTVGSDIISNNRIENQYSYPPITFKATPDNWTLDRDFGRFMDLGGETFRWNRESGIRFSRDFAFLGSIIYVDPNPNFKETITNDPSKPYPTSVPEPVSGLALLGISALGAGSLLKRKDK
ncbi:hypothetical protein [Moorena bouillonii]|uniref:PEP-CTERM protein-sorting domain-containing protein n=1 Tax=Moorena bouillonii PNG TaxID=568701 RepID=A0A1U7N652_9CYAN|nr:hypothetical protein [Moorena bouillonii]OLT61428.1 hypothetical protein BJP37_22865 [Moorena bouillonii PNG]